LPLSARSCRPQQQPQGIQGQGCSCSSPAGLQRQRPCASQPNHHYQHPQAQRSIFEPHRRHLPQRQACMPDRTPSASLAMAVASILPGLEHWRDQLIKAASLCAPPGPLPATARWPPAPRPATLSGVAGRGGQAPAAGPAQLVGALRKQPGHLRHQVRAICAAACGRSGGSGRGQEDWTGRGWSGEEDWAGRAAWLQAAGGSLAWASELSRALAASEQWSSQECSGQRRAGVPFGGGGGRRPSLATGGVQERPSQHRRWPGAHQTGAWGPCAWPGAALPSWRAAQRWGARTCQPPTGGEGATLAGAPAAGCTSGCSRPAPAWRACCRRCCWGSARRCRRPCRPRCRRPLPCCWRWG
jgi:hypothetical protein